MALVSTLAIGDIHGNRRALDDLLLKLQSVVQREDTVVFLGDYIDRGPDAKGFLDSILAFKASVPAEVVCLLGNHEDWLLRTYADFTRHSWVLGMEAFDTIASYSREAAVELRSTLEDAGPRLLAGGVALPYDLFFSVVPRSHLDFLQTLQPYLRTPDALCVHGGLDPEIADLDQQPRAAFLWGTDDFPDKYRGPHLVVYGHCGDCLMNSDGWPVPRIGAHAIGIDTIAHGVLTAIRLPDRCVFQSERFEIGR